MVWATLAALALEKGSPLPMEVGEVVVCRRGTKHEMSDDNSGAIGEIEEWFGRTRRRSLAQRNYVLERILGCR